MIVCVLLGASLAGLGATVRAEPSPDTRVSAARQGTGTHLAWRRASAAGPAGVLDAPPWPQVEIGGARLPAQLIALRAAGDTPVIARLDALESAPWHGVLPASEAVVPRTAAGELRAGLSAQADRRLPSSPVTVLRDGRLRGTRIVVLAVSSIFEQAGQLRMLQRLEATVPQTAPLADSAAAAQVVMSDRAPGTTSLATSAALPVAATQAPAVPIPANPAAARASFTIRVGEAGIQRLPAEALSAAGLDLATLDPRRLQLQHAGAAVALEERGTADGKLDPGDELRFYAPTPSDRWNASDTYWLTVESTPGLRMGSRSALPAGAPLRSTALETGAWQHNAVYDSTLAGPAGDHWFAADLRTGPGQPPASLTVPLTPSLPLAAGTVTLTITGSAYTAGQHSLAVQMDTTTSKTNWSGAGTFSQTVSLAANAASAQLALVPGTLPDGVEPRGVAWSRPVTLDFAGRGGAFSGVPGRWRYQLANTPSARTLFDVTDPDAPSIIAIPDGDAPQFEDGPEPRHYLLAGPGTLRTPSVTRHTPIDLATPLNADVVYIAPSAFASALAPLVARREAQGHVVRVVDVQAIYDTWSFGQVSPTAIRQFLQYAAGTWQRPPVAAILVGDGSSDPLNYLGRNNINWIPPYLAMVDPWIGETACETCYAQLDGADPLGDPLPDLVLGRLPVKSVDEARALVAKIIAYETGPLDLATASRVLYVADNYRDANGAVDSAGDFAAFADTSAALQPPGIDIQRMYYDPSPSSSGVAWREPDAIRAHERTLAALDAGAGIATYAGHSHYYQWAVTDPAATPSYLLGLYDADSLRNNRRLPILLEMTCLTSAFQQPAYSGTTIDERLLLSDAGGVAAVWGPTGLGVAHGHDALQRGFYRALWSAPSGASLGALTQAGYLELFTTGSCCQDTLRTYALLGDPLTVPRVLVPRRVFLPAVRR